MLRKLCDSERSGSAVQLSPALAGGRQGEAGADREPSAAGHVCIVESKARKLTRTAQRRKSHTSKEGKVALAFEPAPTVH